MQVMRDPAPAAAVPEAPSCPVCGAPECRPVHTTPDQALLRCRGCTVVYGWPIFAEQDLLEYTEAAYRGEGVEETAGLFDRCRAGSVEGPLHREYRRALGAIRRRAPGPRLLDVGCGIGTFLHLARETGFTVDGIDPMAEACRIARDDFGLGIRQGTFRREAFGEERYDVITLWDFLEHVPDPLEALTLARSLLVDAGVIFICVPNHRSILYDVASALSRVPSGAVRAQVDKLYHFSHVTLWTPRALAVALGRAGFTAREHGTEGPDLGRYRLSLPVRAALEAVDLAGRLTGRRSRLWMLGEAG